MNTAADFAAAKEQTLQIVIETMISHIGELGGDLDEHAIGATFRQYVTHAVSCAVCLRANTVETLSRDWRLGIMLLPV